MGSTFPAAAHRSPAGEQHDRREEEFYGGQRHGIGWLYFEKERPQDTREKKRNRESCEDAGREQLKALAEDRAADVPGLGFDSGANGQLTAAGRNGPSEMTVEMSPSPPSS
jgi:hypothetical protein